MGWLYGIVNKNTAADVPIKTHRIRIICWVGEDRYFITNPKQQQAGLQKGNLPVSEAYFNVSKNSVHLFGSGHV